MGNRYPIHLRDWIGIVRPVTSVPSRWTISIEGRYYYLSGVGGYGGRLAYNFYRNNGLTVSTGLEGDAVTFKIDANRGKGIVSYGFLAAEQRAENFGIALDAGPALVKRGIIPEPGFGQMKAGRGIRSFMQRGVAACAGEWKLFWTTHNLRKLVRSGQAAGA